MGAIVGSFHWEGCSNCDYDGDCYLENDDIEQDGDNVICTAYKDRESYDEDQDEEPPEPEIETVWL